MKLLLDLMCADVINDESKQCLGADARTAQGVRVVLTKNGPKQKCVV